MAPQPNSMPNSYGDFIIQVQKGLVPGHSILSKFGENPTIAAATPADVWDFPDEPIYTFSSTAAIDSISSDNAGDTADIVVIGLDEDWKLVTQVATLTGLTRAALDTPLIRVHRAFNGNETDLLGNVYIYENTALALGVPVDTTKVRAYIKIGEGQTLLGIYTVPAGKTAYYLGLSSSISRQPAAANCVFTGKIRTFGGVFRTQIRHNLSTTGSSYVEVQNHTFTKFPEKTDFVAHAIVSANGTGISATLDLLLVDD